ncbi:hypothetical protein CW745_06040 [Psychromonas sp. psych-6C06]|uniref:fibronectin type III domain-containing protein n=1 Tax=Psychromonas sp. psych-6C06 TaxID=2058089 RepID=UPI000C320B77|nr:fibronectin type III domain-containing protein [Psychromonas sp. psych-6C06]PKF62984.1 hypothetical protein CW745_06040 [Psychromonas sp. psych-6C06]
MSTMQQKSILRLISSPQNIALLTVLAALLSFVSYRAWQEYLIYQVNELTELFPTAAGGASEVVISWDDYATNEDGYQVVRRAEEEQGYDLIASLPLNSTDYTDSEILPEGEYCYRIAAYNQAGKSYSDDACVWVDDPAAATDPTTTTTITSQFSGRPGRIKLDGREFYSFKSNYPYNSDYTMEEVTDLNFDINAGLLKFKDSGAYRFKEQGEELDRGFAKFKFNDKNNVTFSLQGYGKRQVATLYLSLGVWGLEGGDAALHIQAGEMSHLITLPTLDTWHYATVDISFDEYTPVTITPLGRHKGKSAIRVAGIIFTEANTE